MKALEALQDHGLFRSDWPDTVTVAPPMTLPIGLMKEQGCLAFSAAMPLEGGLCIR